MKKVLFSFLMMFFVISANCSAMTFSQPVEIGKISLAPMGLFEVEGYAYHKGTTSTKKEYAHLNMYEQGLARFGDGEDALYFRYDSNQKVETPNSVVPEIFSKFGSQDAKNNVQVLPGIPTTIFRIRTDSGITFYMLSHGDAAGFGTHQTLIGRRKDGTFVKYFETREIKKRYFDSRTASRTSDELGKIAFEENTMIIRYGKYDVNGFVPSGEFRFKWDDSAQWFGVERVVY